MLDPRRWIDGVLDALADEIKHRHRPEGAERLALGEGHRADGWVDADGYRYEFRGVGRTRVPGLLGGELRIRARRSVTVRVEYWPGPHCLRLVSPEDLGETVTGCELRYHDDRVLQALCQRVLDTRSAAIDRIEELFIPQESDLHRTAERVVPPPRSLAHLNQSQRRAVLMALGAPISRIWGPPGTGKTLTAAALAAEWIRAGRSVVLTAPTNVSTDRLLLAVLETLGWERERVEGRIVRLGDIDSVDLQVRWGDVVSPATVAARRRTAAQADLESAAEQIAELRNGLPGDRSSTGHGGHGVAVEREIQIALRRLTAARQRAAVTPRDIVDGAEVVATTAHRVALGQVRSMDALVMDEACMVALPVGILASMSARQVTLVGDPRQLGPIVQSPSRRARLWLGTGIFEASDQSSSFPVVQGPTTLLTDQHRMPQAVCTLVSQLSYEGALRTAESRLRRDNGAPGPALHPLMYLSTESRLPPGRAAAGPRYANRPQADLVVDIARRVVADRPSLRGEVVIITPYRAHVRALREAARRADLLRAVDISTVHRMQGRERRFVVLSFPDYGEPLSPFLQARLPSDEGGRLLTVAASRASDQLLVVGHLAWLARAAPCGGVLLRFLRLLKELGAPWPTHTSPPFLGEHGPRDSGNGLPNLRERVSEPTTEKRHRRTVQRRRGW